MKSPFKNTNVAKLLVVLGTLAAIVADFRMFDKGPSEDRRMAIEAAANGRFEEAIEYAQKTLARHPSDTQIIILAADAAHKTGDTARAVDFLDQLPAKFDDYATHSAWLRKTEFQLSIGRPSAARDTLQQIIFETNGDVVAARRLARLLAGFGQRYEAEVILRSLLARRDVVRDDLLQLARNGRGLFGEGQLLRLQSLAPEDPLPALGLFASAMERRDLSQLSAVAETLTDQSAAAARCRIQSKFLTDATPEAITAEIRIIQASAAHPESLLLLSELANQRQDADESVRLLYDAIRLDPWNIGLLQAMSDALQSLDHSVAGQFRSLVAVLRRIERQANEVSRSKNAPETVRSLVEDLKSIGRNAESNEWARSVLQSGAKIEWARQIVADSTASEETTDAGSVFKHPIYMVSLPTEEALPADDINNSIRDSVGPADQTVTSAFAFHDVASNSGLIFRYDNGSEVGQEGLKMHQWTGGGVAVFDLDGDSWPDIYLTQAGSLTNSSNTNQSDALFRNGRGSGFQLASENANINEVGFGQGVAAGDINSDGFDDLYIANVGSNRVLMNQGDGTFVAHEPDVSAPSVWTTSVAIADLNHDTIPDLFDVNYIGGDGVFTATCDHGGLQRICGPTDFPAEPDRAWISDGSGNFQETLVPNPTLDARGMGLVVTDLTNSGTNLVFVTNDEAANQLLGFSADNSSIPDTAFESGVALNHFGQAQGSMGIAAGDIDQNGMADLFVTNYYAEANTLYSQVSSSAFVDRTSQAGLASPGFAMLGFGCQFLDADSDGDLDLMVANGHLDDFTHLNHPFRMPPQMFANIGQSMFSETKVDGDYFGRNLLGRAVATVDWNRDLSNDLIVTHLGDEVSLLQNSTKQQQPTITIHLVGVSSARVPIGAKAEINNSGRKDRKWLAAGNGYQCSNERKLSFAIRKSLRQDSSEQCDLTISWPGANHLQTVTTSSGSEFTIVEGRLTPYPIPR